MFSHLIPVLSACVALLCASTLRSAIVLDQEKATYATLSAQTVTMSGRSELHITGTGDPIPGCTFQLNSEDSWIFFPAIAPSSAAAFLSRVQVKGTAAVLDSNIRVVQYVNGSVLIPYPADHQPLEVFAGAHLTGASRKLSPYASYDNTLLGAFGDNIRSFVLKRGYTATFAQNDNGSGASVNYVAQDADLEVSVLPASLSGKISFVRVFPWRWVSKKGTCDTSPVALNASWNYNWNISSNSTSDWEYVAIKQQRWWPGLNQDWKWRGVNHLLGYNEPNNPVEDAYKSLDNGSTSTAIANWPELLWTGLRVGAPAVTDGGYNWIVDFMNKADAAGLRVDYVPVHYYRSYWNNNDPQGAANSLYAFLKSIYDATGRPIWVTEFNNGANWTGGADPTFEQNKNVIQAMITMMDATPWIERYSVYSAVEEVRQVYYNAGGLTPMGVMYRDHKAPIAYRQAVPDSGIAPSADYLFEGHTRDTFAGNNPLAYGTPKLVPGKNGPALSFDGTDDYLALPARLGDSTDFTFAAWVKWNGGADWQRIFDLGNGTAYNLFLCPKTGSNLRFAIKNNGAEQQLNGPALTAGVWTHVAVTLAGNTGKLFVNGSLVATNTAMTINPVQLGTATNYLGKSQYPDPLFNGLLDDVRFLGTALTDAQIAALPAASPPEFVATPSVEPATVDQPFVGSLSTIVASGTAPFTFAKLSGPSWLSIAADGSLVGVPTLADAGPNELVVRVTGADGAGATALLTLTVEASDFVARLPFDGNALASVGLADATLTGGPAYAVGQRGQALDLDGVDDYATLPVGVASGDGFTFAAWVQWDGGGNWQRIFDFGTGTNSYLFLTPKAGDGSLRFVIRNGGADQLLTTSALATGTWIHIAVTLGDGVGRLYVNGTLAASNTAMTLKPSAIRPTLNYLGKSQYPDPLFNGRIDDVHLFRRALDASEINTLRTASAPVFAVNPRTLASAAPGAPYEATLAGSVASDAGPVAFAKVAGPRWLTVEPDGRISGVPDASDAGNTPFRIRASSSSILAADLDLRIPVAKPSYLIAHYELDGSPADSAGGASAVANGSPAYVAGRLDKAALLDGVDDYMQLPAGLVSGLSAGATFSARFRWAGGGAWQRVFDFGNNTTQYFFLTPSSASGGIDFTITAGGIAGNQTLSAAGAPVGEWTHVAVVLGGNVGTLYVNGVVAYSGPITLTPANLAPTLNYLGKSQWPDPYFNGAIDDFRLFNRALDAGEVRKLAIPPAPTLVPRSGFDGWASGQAFPAGENLPVSDPDQDGLANLLEWIFGTDPLASAGSPLAASLFPAESLDLAADGHTYLALVARVRKNRPGVTLIPEAASTVTGLAEPGAADRALPAGPPVDDGDFEIFTWYYDTPVDAGSSGFMRLRVEQD